MSPALTGAVVGLILGLASFFAIRFASRVIEANRAKGGAVMRQGVNSRVLRFAGWADLLFYPLAGYAIGYFFFTPAT
ncbi:MAG: hypothetical protein AAFQ45_13905 [Pseudomonadota bacterium]